MRGGQDRVPAFDLGPGLRWVTRAFLATGVLWAAAVAIWLGFGGRTEFTTAPGPHGWTVLVPAWLGLAGIVVALAGCVLFARQMVGAILLRLDDGGLLDAPRAQRQRRRR